MSDPMDQPEGQEIELVMPFVACQSQGGPYEDESFAAGWQACAVAASLEIADPLHVATMRWPIFRTALARQVDLIAMRYKATAHIEASDAYPEWGELTITMDGTS